MTPAAILVDALLHREETDRGGNAVQRARDTVVADLRMNARGWRKLACWAALFGTLSIAGALLTNGWVSITYAIALALSVESLLCSVTRALNCEALLDDIRSFP